MGGVLFHTLQRNIYYENSLSHTFDGLQAGAAKPKPVIKFMLGLLLFLLAKGDKRRATVGTFQAQAVFTDHLGRDHATSRQYQSITPSAVLTRRF